MNLEERISRLIDIHDATEIMIYRSGAWTKDWSIEIGRRADGLEITAKQQKPNMMEAFLLCEQQYLTMIDSHRAAAKLALSGPTAPRTEEQEHIEDGEFTPIPAPGRDNNEDIPF